MHLTEQAIDAAIDTISGYVVSVVAGETGKPIAEVADAFLASDTCALLNRC